MAGDVGGHQVTSPTPSTGLQEVADRWAEERAALRRVSELVAKGANRDEVLDAIVTETCRLFPVDYTTMLAYDSDDGASTIVALYDGPPGLSIGERALINPKGLVLRAFHSAQPVRVDSYADMNSPEGDYVHKLGVVGGAGAPIIVDGKVWGVLCANSRSAPVQQGLEYRLADFADLAAMAIATTHAKEELRLLADEQAALRRVAELAARGVAAGDFFERSAVEASAILRGAEVLVVRFESDGGSQVVGTVGGQVPVGPWIGPAPHLLSDAVRASGQAARVDDFSAMPGATATAQDDGVNAVVAAPIKVEGAIWGMLVVTSADERLPRDTERTLSQFADIAAVAIANAENRAKLKASRARVVATADETRRRLQRDVHDGAQQRLVQTVINLKLARDAVSEDSAAAERVAEALYHAERASRELRDLVHGILPASLTQGGLKLGLESLIRDISVPVQLRLSVPPLPREIETTAYFIVAEALTNVVKHAQATHAEVQIRVVDAGLSIDVTDDGRGGATFSAGTGLIGLADRVEAADGSVTLTSAVAQGTELHIELPLDTGH